MVSKEKFLRFAATAEKNSKILSTLETTLEGYPLGELSIFSLLNSAHIIAGDYLDMEEDYFYEDFWTMINEDKVEFQIIKGEETIDVTLSNWEEFYDYYSTISWQKQKDR